MNAGLGVVFHHAGGVDGVASQPSLHALCLFDGLGRVAKKLVRETIASPAAASGASSSGGNGTAARA